MYFRKSQNPIVSHTYKIGDHTISARDLHRELGIMLQCNLSWANHYDYICSKAYKILGLLRRSFLCLTLLPLNKSCTSHLLDLN